MKLTCLQNFSDKGLRIHTQPGRFPKVYPPFLAYVISPLITFCDKLSSQCSNRIILATVEKPIIILHQPTWVWNKSALIVFPSDWATSWNIVFILGFTFIHVNKLQHSNSYPLTIKPDSSGETYNAVKRECMHPNKKMSKTLFLPP